MSIPATEIIPLLWQGMTDKEKAEVEKHMGPILNKQLSPCEKLGHKYRKVGQKINWFMPPSAIMCCERCGHKKKV